LRAVIILDTNVVTEVMKASPAAAVVSWLNAQDSSALFLTAKSDTGFTCCESMVPSSVRGAARQLAGAPALPASRLEDRVRARGGRRIGGSRPRVAPTGGPQGALAALLDYGRSAGGVVPQPLRGAPLKVDRTFSGRPLILPQHAV
jgi:hypothetical protein